MHFHLQMSQLIQIYLFEADFYKSPSSFLFYLFIYFFLQIERVAKLVIPLAFLAFNLAYWPVVLVKYFDGR